MSDFYYQIGSVKTEIAWCRPSYEIVKAFLSDPSILPILTKYDIHIVSGFLLDSDTWDLDLCVIMDHNESTDWYLIESDLNKIIDCALNVHMLLLDISISQHLPDLPTKRKLIKDNEGLPVESWVAKRSSNDTCILVKMGYYKKVINGVLEFERNLEGTSEKLTNGYLYKIDNSMFPHTTKMVKKILQLEKINHVENLQTNQFLSMTEEEFKASLNSIIETFTKYGI